jgi:cobalt-zinc-cadmium efflux system outer membrane protein
LATFAWEVRAREAAVLQAGLLPNPELTIESENFGGSGDTSGFDGSENTLSLSQLVELGGKRTKRRDVAGFERDSAAWDYETARIDTLTDVSLAFVELLAAQERKALAEELVGVGEAALKVVGDQVKAGAVSSVEKSRAEVALASSRVESARRSRELEAARVRMAATWGSTTVAFTEAVGGLDDTLAPLPAEQTLLRQVEENPDLARWATELSARRARVALEQSRRIPDVTLGGGSRWFNETDDNAFVVGLTVPLPLFDRNQGGVLEANQRLAKAAEQRRAADVEVKTALSTAYQSLAATYDAVVALQRDVLPKAQAAFDGATTAYRRGVFRYLDVLDSQRTLFALRSEYLDTLAAHYVAIARVERLVGRSLAEIRDEDRRS